MTLSAVVRPDGAAGGTALLTASWNFASSEGGQPDWLVITGTKGTLRLTVADTNTPLELITCEGTQRIEFDPPSSIQQPMIQTVVRAWLRLEVWPHRPPADRLPPSSYHHHARSKQSAAGWLPSAWGCFFLTT